MSDLEFRSYLEGMKMKFWHQRQHLQNDEIQRQWAASTAAYTSILLDTEAPTRPPALTPNQGQQTAHQSVSKSWGEAAAKRPASGTVTPLELGQCYNTAPSSEPMSRKRARTSQYGPDSTAKNAISVPSLDTNTWQLDNNAPYCGYTNTSTSGPSFKARRTPAGRMPIKIPEGSPSIKIYEPAEYIQQTKAFPSSSLSPNTRPQSDLFNHCVPPASFDPPPSFSVSPTTTISERFTVNTAPTSAAMSRQDSLAASFCGAFGMMRASSGVSETDLSQNIYRQDSCHGSRSHSFSTDGQGVGTAFDPSLYFAHAGGTAIESTSASVLAAEQLQLPPTLDLETEMRRDVSSSSMSRVEPSQLPSSLELHTNMMRDASAGSTASSTSRISRRSQEQIAQAARPIAPKDVAGSPKPKSSSSWSGSQDMLRQRSAPEPKVLIPKLQYSRQTKQKLKCERCDKNPEGYRGSHELHRHMALDHNPFRTAWVCVDISPDGFLSGCAACDSEKPYGQDYNAAAHLRRFHFHPKSDVRRTNVDPETRRGGKGGGKDPSMSECRRWMKKIQVRGKDHVALADSAVDDAGDDADQYDEESKEEQGEQDLEDLSMLGNVRENDGSLLSHDGAIPPQIFRSPYDGADDLELALTSDRQFNLQIVDTPFSQSSFQPDFEASFRSVDSSNAASLTAPSIDLAYSRLALSSSAPAPTSFLSSISAGVAHAHDDFASNTPVSHNLPFNMSMTSTAHNVENSQASYIPSNISYGMSSPNNPQVAYGLLDFPPYQ